MKFTRRGFLGAVGAILPLSSAVVAARIHEASQIAAIPTLPLIPNVDREPSPSRLEIGTDQIFELTISAETEEIADAADCYERNQATGRAHYDMELLYDEAWAGRIWEEVRVTVNIPHASFTGHIDRWQVVNRGPHDITRVRLSGRVIAIDQS